MEKHIQEHRIKALDSMAKEYYQQQKYGKLENIHLKCQQT